MKRTVNIFSWLLILLLVQPAFGQAPIRPRPAVNPSGVPTREQQANPEDGIEEDDGNQEQTLDGIPVEGRTPTNPLQPAGDSLDLLIRTNFNDDVWAAMLGELPCLEATESCIKTLQDLAVNNSRQLQAISQRIDIINGKIDEGRANNAATITLETYEPLIQRLIKFETATAEKPSRGFFDNLFDFIASPIQGVNEVLSLIGLPLFKNSVGGDAAAQTRSIAIADLQIKITEIENYRGELTAKIREQVMLSVLDFDQTRREFQISQEVIKREVIRQRLVEIDYRFATNASLTTDAYLGRLSALDTKKAQSYRDWAKLRRELARIKILVLGDPDIPD